jgi:hypothetical protein
MIPNARAEKQKAWRNTPDGACPAECPGCRRSASSASVLPSARAMGQGQFGGFLWNFAKFFCGDVPRGTLPGVVEGPNRGLTPPARLVGHGGLTPGRSPGQVIGALERGGVPRMPTDGLNLAPWWFFPGEKGQGAKYNIGILGRLVLWLPGRSLRGRGGYVCQGPAAAYLRRRGVTRPSIWHGACFSREKQAIMPSELAWLDGCAESVQLAGRGFVSGGGWAQ